MAQPAEREARRAAVARRRVGDGVCVIAASGSLEVPALPALRDELLAALDDGCRDVVVELGSTGAVDDAALALLELLRRHRLPGEIVAVCPDRSLADRLARTGLRVEPSLEDALASLSQDRAG